TAVVPASILRLCLAAAAAAALLFPPQAGAATITVTPAPGELQNAVSSARNGDVIVLTAGTYLPTVSLKPAASITLQGPTSGPGATISGASIVPDVNGVDDILVVDNGISVTARNLAFTASKADGAAGTILDQGTLLVESSTYSGNNGPSVVVGNGTATIRNTTIAGNGDDAVQIGGSAILENDTITSNNGRGLANPTPPARTLPNTTA